MKIGVLGCTLLLAACGTELPPPADDDAPPPPEPPPTGCGAGDLVLDDMSCLPAGMQPSGCAAGEVHEDGGCRPAGVAESACAGGFVHDGERACVPLLPATPCALGAMAIPGESRCREVGPCGTAPWGDVVTDATTEFVDGSHVGASTGSSTQPWKTIQDGIANAEAGAVVAVAAGSYAGNVTISGKPVTLWGRCPALVEIVASGGVGTFGVTINAGADGTIVRGLAVRGSAQGMQVRDAADVVIDRLWIHDLAERGLQIAGFGASTSATVTGTLVERNRYLGVVIAGAAADIRDSVIRDTEASSSGQYGVGLTYTLSRSGEPSEGALSGSLIEGNRRFQALVQGSALSVERTVLRGTVPEGAVADGIFVEHFGGIRGSLELKSSLVEAIPSAALRSEGADVTVADCVFRDSAPFAQASFGLFATRDGGGVAAPSVVSVSSSLFTGIAGAGIVVEGSEASIDGCAILDLQPGPDGTLGRGLVIQSDLDLQPSDVTLTSCLVERAHEIGVFVAESTATIDGCAVRDTLTGLDDAGGIGMLVQTVPGAPPVEGTVRWSSIDGAYTAGIAVVNGTLTVEGTIVRAVRANPHFGDYGDGIVAAAQHGPADVSVRGSLVADNERAGIAAFGATGGVVATRLECNAIHLAGEDSEVGPVALEDQGGNSCGCDGVEVPCKILMSELKPPVLLP